jgi:hypothetical protein
MHSKLILLCSENKVAKAQRQKGEGRRQKGGKGVGARHASPAGEKDVRYYENSKKGSKGTAYSLQSIVYSL